MASGVLEEWRFRGLGVGFVVKKVVYEGSSEPFLGGF